jgi:hypothetical protein
MDPALPPGGLDRIFKQYDAIRSHGTASDTPPWEPEDEQQQQQQQQQQQASEPAEATREQETSAPPTELRGFITPLAADGRVTVEGFAPPQKILTDGTRPRPVGRPKSWTEDADTKKREEEAARLQKFNSDYSNRGTFKADEEGMSKAYADTTYPGVYYDPQTRTEYVKGTVPTNLNDWIDDVTKIPVWGDIHDADRMKMAEAAYQDLIKKGKPVDRVVGHSLGGSVALQLQKDHDIPFSRTFGAPVLDLNPFQNAERYRHPLDPFSILDRGATNTSNFNHMSINTHSYGGFSGAKSLLGFRNLGD